MRPFNIPELWTIREMRLRGAPMRTICAVLHRHSRDDVVEAIFATIGHEDDLAALKHLHEVLAMREAHVPLINGREAWKVTPSATTRPQPMF